MPESMLSWLSKLEKVHTKTTSDPFKPQTLEEYIGQKKAKRVVSIIVRAALKDDRPLPNTLITGSFGQGKTSLARIMADNYDPAIPIIDAASVNKNAFTKGTRIIDEIHNLGPDICDSLNILLDNGDVHIIGCTTNPGALPAAFRSRFRTVDLEPYTEQDISAILSNVVKRKGLSISPKALSNISKRARFNPRFALNYLAFIFDLATLDGTKNIEVKLVDSAFEELGVDEHGFLSRDYAYLEALPKDGKPVGLQYLSAITSIDPQTIEQEVEPYLLRKGLIDRTPKGRKIITAVV